VSEGGKGEFDIGEEEEEELRIRGEEEEEEVERGKEWGCFVDR